MGDDTRRHQLNRAAALVHQFTVGGELADLDEAICIERALMDAVTEPELQAVVLNNLGDALRMRSRVSRSRTDLRDAVSALRAATAGAPASGFVRARMFSNLGHALTELGEQTGRVAYLDEAVGAFRAAAASVGAGEPGYQQGMYELAVAHRSRFLRDGGIGELDAAVDALRAAADVDTDGPVGSASVLNALGSILRLRFERAGRAADLDNAVAAHRGAVECDPVDECDRALSRSNLAGVLWIRSRVTGSAEDLDEAIDQLRQAVGGLPPEHGRRVEVLADLSNALQERYVRSSAPADVEDAIATLTEAAALPSDEQERRAIAVDLSNSRTSRYRMLARGTTGGPEHAAALTDLGYGLTELFDQTGELTYLDQALHAYWSALEDLPPDRPDRGLCMANLVAARRLRFHATGNQQDLRAAVALGRHALDGFPPGHPARAAVLISAGEAVLSLAKQSSDPAVLDEATAILRESVETGGVAARTGLAAALMTRYEREGRRETLEDALEQLRSAAAVASGPVERPPALNNLCGALVYRYRWTSATEDLDAAVEAGREAVDLSPERHSQRPGFQSNLAGALRLRFWRTGSLADLDEAVALYQTAAVALPRRHPATAMVLYNQGGALVARFEQTGRLADLDRAIDLAQRAVDVSAGDDPQRAMYLSGLGDGLRARFDRTGDPDDLDRALQAARAAVAVATADQPGYPAYVSSLALSLREQFLRTRDEALIDEAVSRLRAAVDRTPAGDPGRAGLLSGLAVSLLTRADLDAAVRSARDAVAAAPADDQQQRAALLANLAIALRARATATGAAADREEARRRFKEAARTPAASPLIRAQCGRSWTELAGDEGRWDEAGIASRLTLDLLPRLASWDLPRADQEHHLARLDGVAQQAAAAALARDEVEAAATLLEEGRAVLLGRVLRTDTELRRAHPVLAEELDDARRALLAGWEPVTSLPRSADGLVEFG